MKEHNASLTLIRFSFLSFFLYSCDPGLYDPYIVPESRQKENVYYAPAAQNAPLLSNKNDLSFSAGFGVTSNQSGIDAHGAFNPAKNFGLLAGMRSYNHESEGEGSSMNSYEFGAGYLKELPQLWHFEIYGGVGSGNVHNIHHTGDSKVRFSNFFLQPAIAVQNSNKTIQFAFVSRFSSNNFKIEDTSFNSDREPFVAKQMNIIHNQSRHLMWEPGFLLRAGWENILFKAGFSICSDLTDKDFYHDKTNFSVGIVFRGNVGKNKH